MLNVLRDNLKGPILRWVLGLVAISLILYLGAYFFRDSGRTGGAGDWAARVDGEPITSAKFFASAQRMEEYYRQLMGERFDQLKPQLRLGSQAIQSLVDERIQIDEAKSLGLVASPDEIAHYIQPHPSLSELFGESVLAMTGRSLHG
jgi:hypothetical protein